MVRKSHGMRGGCCWHYSSEQLLIHQRIFDYWKSWLLLSACQTTSHERVNSRSDSVFWVRRRSSESVYQCIAFFDYAVFYLENLLPLAALLLFQLECEFRSS